MNEFVVLYIHIHLLMNLDTCSDVYGEFLKEKHVMTGFSEKRCRGTEIGAARLSFCPVKVFQVKVFLALGDIDTSVCC